MIIAREIASNALITFWFFMASFPGYSLIRIEFEDDQALALTNCKYLRILPTIPWFQDIPHPSAVTRVGIPLLLSHGSSPSYIGPGRRGRSAL